LAIRVETNGEEESDFGRGGAEFNCGEEEEETTAGGWQFAEGLRKLPYEQYAGVEEGPERAERFV
jgi:hypothetical protein